MYVYVCVRTFYVEAREHWVSSIIFYLISGDRVSVSTNKELTLDLMVPRKLVVSSVLCPVFTRVLGTQTQTPTPAHQALSHLPGVSTDFSFVLK